MSVASSTFSLNTCSTKNNISFEITRSLYTQGRCGLSAKKLPASPGEKRSVETNPSLLSKDDVTLQQPLQTHTPSGSHKNHICLSPTDQTWWKEEPMIDMDTNLSMDSPSGWVENYQDLSSWCYTPETTSYLWPTTDESSAQPAEYQGEIDFDLVKSEEIASVPLQEDSWGEEGTGNISLNLPPVPVDRWGPIMGNASTNAGLNSTAKPLEPVLVNDCWLLDIEHEEVVKGESESVPKAESDATKSSSFLNQQRPTLVETKQVQQNLERRTALGTDSLSYVRVKEEPREFDSSNKTGSGDFVVPTTQRPSGKLWSEQIRESRPRKPMYSFKKLEQREVQRNPGKVQLPASTATKALTTQVRFKDRPASPDLFEEVHRKVVAMTAKSAAAAVVAAVKKENTPEKVQRASTLPRLDFNIGPIIMDPEPGPGNSSMDISTPEVLKSLADGGEMFDLFSYVLDDKVMTPPVPLDSGNPKANNPFHFPKASHGKPSIQDLPGYRIHNPNYRVAADNKLNVNVVRPMFSKKIEGGTVSEEEKPSTSVVVEVQPQILPTATTYKEEVDPEHKFTPMKRKRQDSVVSDLNVRIDEPRTTRKKQLHYRRDDDEVSLDDDDDDDDDFNMKDDENDEDFTLEPVSKRRKRRTSESSTASRRSRTSVQSTKRNNQDRRTSTTDSDRYRELRDRNNEASRKSRLTRKAKEQELMVREKELAKENQILKVKSEEMENLVKRLREALLQNMMKK